MEATGGEEKGRRTIGGMCGVKSQPGEPECPRTAQPQDPISSWLATTAQLDWMSESNFRETVTKSPIFLRALHARNGSAGAFGGAKQRCPPQKVFARNTISAPTMDL